MQIKRIETSSMTPLTSVWLEVFLGKKKPSWLGLSPSLPFKDLTSWILDWLFDMLFCVTDSWELWQFHWNLVFHSFFIFYFLYNKLSLRYRYFLITIAYDIILFFQLIFLLKIQLLLSRSSPSLIIRRASTTFIVPQKKKKKVYI